MGHAVSSQSSVSARRLTSVLSEPSSFAMHREMEENSDKMAGSHLLLVSCILVIVCSSQVSAPDLDIMHGTLLPVHTSTHISLIAVMPWSISPDPPLQLQGVL